MRRAMTRATSRDDAKDRGTFSLFTAIFAVFVIMLAGLVVDGGLAIHARERAADIAEQAARAGADDIDLGALRATGEPSVDTATACEKARDLAASYADQISSWTCDPSPEQVSVRITIQVEPQLLDIIPGLGPFTMTSTATARPERGGDEG
ncbi:MAG TPA: pilus assembly protein TadG-related protein [Streptosporangiaceae bacterium]